MPNASKYIVDINKISKPGNVATSGIFIGNGSGNRESLFACRGTGSDSVVIYDKVLYYLNVDNITNQDPAAHTVTFTYTSKRTHGNNVEDTLGINPTTSAITANHSTASTKTTTCVVNQSLTNNGTLTGNSVSVTVTQNKNYPTGLTLTISPKSTIPASGGSISSALTNFNYSVTAYYKSGSNSAVTSDSHVTITANVSGVTANSKETTASTQTSAGTIEFTAKYVCNDVTVTNKQTVTIYQDKNGVINTNYLPSNYEALISIGTGITAGDSTASVTASARHLAYDLYDSGSYNNQHYVADGVSVAEVYDNNSRYSYANGVLTHNSMTTNLTTDTCTLRATNNTSTSATKDASVSVTNTRQHEGDTPSNYIASITINNKGNITAGGGSTSVSASASHTNTFTWAYTSGSKLTGQTETITDTADVTEDSDPNNRYSYANGVLTHNDMTDNLTTDTCTLRVRNHSNTGTTTTDSVSVSNARQHEGDTPSNYVATITINNKSDITAGGGSSSVSASASHINTFTWAYTSGYKLTGQTETITDTADVTEDSDPNNRYSYANGTLTHNDMTDNLTTDTCTLRVRNHSNTGTTTTDSVSVTNTRQHEGDTPSNYTATISIGSGINCTGGTATVSASAKHTNTFTWAYTSGYKLTGQTETITDTANVTEDSDPNNRYSYSNGTLSHTSMNGSPGATDNCTLRVRNASSTATTNTASVSVSNSLSSTEWYTPSVTITPSSASVGSAATSTSFTASASQSGKNNYCAGDTASTSNSSFTYDWSSSDSTNFSVNTSGTVTISANPNDTTRSATITLKATGAGSKSGSTTATITQAAKESKLTPYIDHVYNGYYSIDGTDGRGLSRHFTSGGTAQTLVIQSDSSNPWTLISNESWIYVSTTGGTGDANVTISASTNSSSSDRSSTQGITFKKSLTPNNNTTWVNRYINVSQSGTGSTPSTGTWSIINSNNNYGLYGTWTASNYSGQISGDWAANHTTTQNTTVPITLVSFVGAVTSISAGTYSGTPTIQNTNTSQSITLTKMDPSQQAYSWSGSFVVNNGDVLTLTF